MNFVQSFRCSVCNNTFATENTVRNHMRYSHVETVRKPFACEVADCSKAYVLQQSLLKHVREAHDNCISDSSSTMRTTKLEMQRVNELMCEQCGKIFRSSSALKVSFRFRLYSILYQLLINLFFSYCNIWGSTYHPIHFIYFI